MSSASRPVLFFAIHSQLTFPVLSSLFHLHWTRQSAARRDDDGRVRDPSSTKGGVERAEGQRARPDDMLGEVSGALRDHHEGRAALGEEEVRNR